MKERKTITLGYKDNPTVSICEGHVSVKEFQKAFSEEGWSESDDMDVVYEYRIKLKTSWKLSEPGKKGAVPVTASYW